MMGKMSVVALLLGTLGVAGAFDLGASRLGRKLSSLCHTDNCGVWCGPPRGAPCGINKPPCYPPTNVDCYPDNNGRWSNPECYKYCGPNPWQQNADRCGGGNIYVCHAPPPCSPPTKIDCFPTNNGGYTPSSHPECPKYCGPNPWQQNPSQCGGNVFVCHAPPPCHPPQEVFCPWNSQKSECQQFCGASAMPQNPSKCIEVAYICEAPPTSPPPSPPQEKGCMPGNSLPFGLENCICDGAAVGEPAGLAACGRVANECANNVQPFRFGELEAVQQICDTFALDACISSAQMALVNNSGCKDILTNGTPMCTPQKATSIWMESVNMACDPLCKDCVRLGP